MITHRFVETTPVFHMDAPEYFCPRCKRENWDCECNGWPTLAVGYREWLAEHPEMEDVE